MKYRIKKKELIQALVSKDKEKLRKALSINKPEKWLCVKINHREKIIKYQDRTISEEEMKFLIEEASKEFQVSLIVMNIDRREDGQSEIWEKYQPEIVLNFVKVEVFYGDTY